MTYKTSENDLWSVEQGDWVSTKYYDKAELLKQFRRRNMIFAAAFMMYLVVSAIVLFF